ncbi:MAG: hypothetical protein AUJ96_19310 [Armatimonadetes bacterium CG2_30_66_41]|nr:MAG: hypothetical protein AUJ96_19310 [Armatimonadetes bacterium CG2_30_66_41]
MRVQRRDDGVGERGCGSLLTVAVAFLALAVLSAPLRADEQPESEVAALRLTQEKLPERWVVAKEVAAEPEQLLPFGEKLGGKLTAMVSQLLESKSGRVQLNYVGFLIPEEMARAYQRMVQLSRGTMTVLACGRVVLEVGAVDERGAPSDKLMELATSWLTLDPLQALKVKPHQVTGKWLLAEEVVLAQGDLRRVRADTGVEIEAGLNQLFGMTSGEGVRISLLKPTDPARLDRLQAALLRRSELRNKLLVLEGCVAEIAANDSRARDLAISLLQANAKAVRERTPQPEEPPAAEK